MEGRLRAYTEFTLTNVNDLEAEFETIRKRGFAECVEEIERGLCSVAAPLRLAGQVLQCPLVLPDRYWSTRQRFAINLEPGVPELPRMYRNIWAGMLQQTPNCQVNSKVNSQCEPLQNPA